MNVRKMSNDDSVRFLLVDRSDIVMEIAKEFQGFLCIDNANFAPILPFRLSELTTRDRVLLELGIAHMCYAGNLTDRPSLAREQLLDRCNVANSGLRSRLSEMRRDGLIVTTDEGDELTVEGIIEFRKLLTSLRKDHNGKE